MIDDDDPSASFADPWVVAAHDHRGDEAEAVAFLAARSGSGPALELAIGTGRIALPLAATGVQVDGVDLSPQMLDRLRSKPDGHRLNVWQADMIDFTPSRPYRLIYIVWNSLFNVLEQDAQVRVFQTVAQHLTADGRFVIEAFVPGSFHASGSSQIDVEEVAADSLRLGVLRHDAARQTIVQTHVDLSADGLRFNPVRQRYCWPAELDLMARLAGLSLLERWGDWRQQPFDGRSKAHVSVYGR